MAYNRSSEDLLNPERTYYRMIRDYTEGRLTFSRVFYRAVVVDVGTFSGELEADPPSPPGSVRARVYTHGMDANFPDEFLTVFYPLFPDHPPPMAGEHVYVVFEDEDFSSGQWVSRIPNYQDVNYANPDINRPVQRDSADAFNGTQGRQLSSLEIASQYSSLSIQTDQQNQTIASFEGQSSGFWTNQRVLIAGDSMMHGPPGTLLVREINARGGNATKDGRTGWGVSHWLSLRYTGGQCRTCPRSGISLPALKRRTSPNIVLVSLGGNDYNKVSNETSYKASVETLWNQAREDGTRALWIGPPYAYRRRGRGGEIWDDPTFTQGRQKAGRLIKEVVGAENYISIEEETRTQQGRHDGIHFSNIEAVLRFAPNYILKIVNR